MIVGSAHVRVLPDLSQFNTIVKRHLEKVTLRVRVSVDAEKVAPQIERQLARIRPKVTVRVTADTRPMTEQVKAALARLPSVKTISFDVRAQTLAAQARALERLAPQLEKLAPAASAAAAAMDRFGSASERAAAAAAALLAAVGPQARQMGRMASAAQQAGRAQQQMADHSRRVGANAAAASEAIRKLLQEFRNFLVVTAAVQLAGRPFVNLIGFGLQTAATFENARLSLDALLGSTREANRLFTDLQVLAKRTPFAFGDFLGAAQQLIAAGQSGKEVVQTLDAVSTAAAASGAVTKDVLDRAVLALTQIKASGRLLGQDLRQIFQALPAVGRARVFDEIAQAIGVTREEAQSLAEDGLIPSELAFRALIAAMLHIPGATKAVQDQAQSLKGVFQRLRESVQIVFGESFGPVGERLSEALNRAMPQIEATLGSLARTLAKGLGDFLPRAGQLFASLVEAVVTVTRLFFALAPALTGIAQAAAVAAQAFRPIVAILEALPDGLVQVIGATVAFGVVVTRLVPALGALATNLTSLFANLGAKTIALGGALALVTFAFSRHAEAAAKAKARIEALRDAMSRAQDAGDDFATSLARSVAESVLSEDRLKALAKAGITVEEAIQALARSKESFNRLPLKAGRDADALVDSALALKDFGKEMEKAAEAQIAFLVSSGQVTKAQADAATAGRTFTGALMQLVNQMGSSIAKATDLANALSDDERAALRAQAAMAGLRKAQQEVSEVFDATIGRTLGAVSATLNLENAQARLADAQEELRKELEGTDEERRAVIDAESNLTRALEAQRDARERLVDAQVRQREAHQRLAEVMATEAERAADNLLRAQLRLEQSHLRLIELEERRRDLEEQLARAQDPRKIKQLEDLLRLRASVGAAPPSFLDELDRRIDQLKREVGPEAVARIQREIKGVEIDLAEGRLAIKDATLEVKDAERQRLEGTDELKRAIEEAKQADEQLEQARRAVRDATRDVQRAEQELADARKKLEPDAKRVAQLNRDIRQSQLDVVESAVAMAVAVGAAASTVGSEVRQKVIKALDEVLEKIPEIASLFNALSTQAGLSIGMDLTITNIEELKNILQQAVADAIKQGGGAPGGVRFRQHGGPVFAGQAFVVGEAGPELFVPSQSGRILPNRELAALRREAISVQVVAPSTDAREIVDRALERIRTERFLRGW